MRPHASSSARNPMLTIFTIGHATHSTADLLALLTMHGVGFVADVRSSPASRRSPHLAKEPLRAALRDAGLAYRHLPLLGGRRSTALDPSPNGAWHNASFRNYADYMQSALFVVGLDDVQTQAVLWPTVLMCAESVPWRCHRSLIADALVARGMGVQHILGPGVPRPHVLHPCAVVSASGRVSYPAPLCPSKEDR